MPRTPKIKLHLNPNFDRSLLPIPATKYRNWWEENTKTKNHARHCLPLSMAGSLGYYILSPGTFKVTWNGNVNENCHIEHIETSSHYIVDDHAAYASFTIQAGFIPTTERPGEFVIIRPLTNEKIPNFLCMDAAIEAWWAVGNFGLVCNIIKPGEFIVKKGEPIAQMFLYYGQAGSAIMEPIEGLPEEHNAWSQRRSRPGYQKDYDYLKGLKHTGEKVVQHLTNWKDAGKYNHADILEIQTTEPEQPKIDTPIEEQPKIDTPIGDISKCPFHNKQIKFI
jgi:hypothetical protein